MILPLTELPPLPLQDPGETSRSYLKRLAVHMRLLRANLRELKRNPPPKYDHCEAFRAALRQANPASVDIGGETGKPTA